MKFKKIYMIITISILSILMLVGCTSNGPTHPKDIIEEAYGNEQFTISFSTAKLDNPIPSIKYSAKNIPVLPTPERVGYIFSGWYLDDGYTIPYVDNILYLYMKDIILYAKWEKEQFVQDGVYDIKLTAKIDSIKSKGELVDRYPFNDITKDIDYEETCIEKSEDGLQLKFQYTIDENNIGNQVYNVLPSKVMGDKVYIVEKITPENSDNKTLYFNIDKLDITKPIFLDISTMNYSDKELSNEDRVKTKLEYVVELKLNKVIGLSKPFVNPNIPLEKNSYYLVKTHYDTMAETYNAVYSYISVDNEGEYTLIKPFMPYSGLVAQNKKDNYVDNFYSREMAFNPTQIYYKSNPIKDFSQQELNQAEYIPELINGGYYGDYIVEFHADTGKYYMIYKLGKELKGDIIVSGATTGFMEMTDAMGRYNMKMTIDYEHIFKLADIDYRPLEGEAYTFNDKIQYYPGELQDLNSRDLIKDNVDKYGLSSNIFNFYYSASEINAPIEDRNIYSHRYIVTPSKNTASRTTADSRYQISSFDVTTDIFGYDPEKDGKLFGDSMSVNNFGGAGRREKLEIINGKMLNKGDEVRLDTLFLDKVNPHVDTLYVKANIYNLNNGIIDPTSVHELDNIAVLFQFDSDVVVVYEYVNNNVKSKTPVYLKEYTEPKYNDNHIKNGYRRGQTVRFDDFEYTWGNITNHFMDNYYLVEELPTVDPINVGIFNIFNGVYNIQYCQYNTQSFRMNTYTSIAYELNNEFREVKMVYYDYFTDSDSSYEIVDGDKIVGKGSVFYDENDKRRPINISDKKTYEIHDKNKILSYAKKEYKLKVDTETSILTLLDASIYTQSGVHFINDNFEGSFNKILTDAEYGILKLEYSNGTDSYRFTISYNLKVEGKDVYKLIDVDKMFTDYKYYINVPSIQIPNGLIAKGATILIKEGSPNDRYNLVNSNGQYTIEFLTPGNYELIYEIDLCYDSNGDRLFNGEMVKLRLSQPIEVKDSKQDITIKFITDESHPFSSEIPYIKDRIDGINVYCYTISYSIKEKLKTLIQYKNFDISDDELFAWSPRPWSEYNIIDANRMYIAGETIEDLIKTFGTDEIKLYAIWDKGINVHIDLNTSITNQGSYDEKLKLNKDQYKGYYVVNVPKEENIFVPSNYMFVGWTILETGELYSKNAGQILTRQSVTIQATFKQRLIVRFDVDINLGNSIAPKNIIENEKIVSPMVFGKEGYEFVGFRLAKELDDYGRVISINNDNFDFSKPITKEMVSFVSSQKHIVVLVAVFSNKNGDEIWQKEVTP